MRIILGTLTVLAASVLLSGCSASAYPIFDRPPTDADHLSSDFDLFEDMSMYDLTTVRYAGSVEGIELFQMRMSNQASSATGMCIAVGAGNNSSIACGGGSVETSVNGVGSFRLGPAPMSVADGWVVVSDNILARLAE